MRFCLVSVWFPCSVSTLFYSLILCLDLGSVSVGLDFFHFQVDTSPPPFGKDSMALVAIVHSHSFTVSVASFLIRLTSSLESRKLGRVCV